MKTPMSIVLKNLQCQTETAIQTILQTRIMMITDFNFGKQEKKKNFSLLFYSTIFFLTIDSPKAWLQLANVISGHIMLANACTVHSFFEISGKRDYPGSSMHQTRPSREKKGTIITFCLYLTTITCRY